MPGPQVPLSRQGLWWLAGWLLAIGGARLHRQAAPAQRRPRRRRRLAGSGRAGGGDRTTPASAVELAAPARRVIALSPSLTELAFAAGGGDRLVGVAEHSNYPEAARSLPRIGDALAFQMERILALKPDLILAWQQGNNPRQLERLAALGVPIYYSQIGRLEDVATTLERLGRAAGYPGAGSRRRLPAAAGAGSARPARPARAGRRCR